MINLVIGIFYKYIEVRGSHILVKVSTQKERNKTTISQDPPKQPDEVYFHYQPYYQPFSYKNTLHILCNVTTSPKSLSQ